MLSLGRLGDRFLLNLGGRHLSAARSVEPRDGRVMSGSVELFCYRSCRWRLATGFLGNMGLSGPTIM
jgi:hypothetical protein